MSGDTPIITFDLDPNFSSIQLQFSQYFEGARACFVRDRLLFLVIEWKVKTIHLLLCLCARLFDIKID
jgi:hypothetical protein